MLDNRHRVAVLSNSVVLIGVLVFALLLRQGRASAVPRPVPPLGGRDAALAGPNGIGKTRLLQCLDRLGRLLRLLAQNDVPDFAYSVREVVGTRPASHLELLFAPAATGLFIVYDALTRLGVAHLASRALSESSGGKQHLVSTARKAS